MNDYKVIATGIYGEHTVTAIDEKDARRIYRQTHTEGETRRITAIAFVRENVPATKQQEREALEKIKAIVATLGPRSYVGTALEGCLEDAEVNIENDFGDSMRARWMEAENRVAQAAREAAELKNKLQQEIQERQRARDEAQAAIQEAERRAEQAVKAAEDDANFYRDKVLDSDDLTDIAQLIDGHISQLRDMVKASEVAILENAEHPEAKIFKDAVRDRKNLTKDIEYYQALARRVKHARGQ